MSTTTSIGNMSLPSGLGGFTSPTRDSMGSTPRCDPGSSQPARSEESSDGEEAGRASSYLGAFASPSFLG